MSDPDLNAAERRQPELAELAHELRTPLAAIAAAAELLRDARLGALGDPYRGYAAGIHESAAHGLGVLSRWLDGPLTAPERQRLDRAPLDVNALVARCASALEPLALRAGVRLTCRVAPGVLQIAADARSLQQVLFNLVANAFAFTPPGGTVTITTAGAPAGAVSIEVADTGDGMTADELARVRALAGAPLSPAARGGRNGYGLPLVFTLTSANGGTVEITSAPHQGTRVVLRFLREMVKW